MSDLSLQERIDNFLDNLSKLSEKDIISLRRNFNRELENVDIYSQIAYYKIKVSNYEEEIWYFCACLWSYYKHKKLKGNKTIQEIIREEYIKDNNSTLVGKFVELMTFDKVNTVFIYKLGQLLRQLEGKGYSVNVKELLLDLILWNKDNSYVLKKWAEKVYNI